MRKLTALALLSACMSFTAAHADIKVEFDEGAPKDRFTISNLSGCTLEKGELVIDLSKSSAGLIFDTTGRGAGVEVFQPLEITHGAGILSTIPKVKDGDNQVKLAFAGFAPGDKIAFTIDIDDTIGQREITVSGAEIEGAAFSIQTASFNGSGSFDQRAIATFGETNCG